MADDQNAPQAAPGAGSEPWAKQPEAAPSMPKIELKPAGEASKAQAPEVAATKPAPPAAPNMPKPEAPKAPAAPAAEKKPAEKVEKKAAPAEESNVFTELFGDQGKHEDGMMKSVMGQQDEGKKSFLGNKPVKEEAAVDGSPKRKIGGAVLRGAVLLLVLTGGFFFYQNNTMFSPFGPNLAQRTLQTEEQAKEIQGEIHVQNHLAAILLLDKYSSLADEYFYNVDQSESAYVSSNKRAAHKETANELRPELLELMEDIQTRLKEDPEGEEMTYSKAAADDLIDQLRAKKGDVDEQTLLQEIHDFETAKKLMQSQNFKDLVLAVNLNEDDDDGLRAVLSEYSNVNQSLASMIAEIKSQRENWSIIFEEAEDVIKSVDPLFNTEFNGNLDVKTLGFSKEKVDLSGQSVTDDTKNFTLISNLIDAFENSSFFERVQERSFSKSESGEESYIGSFRLSMELTSDDE